MQNLAPGVDTALLNNILVVTIPVHYVAITPSNFILSSPTVRRTWWVFVLCVLISSTIRLYVTVVPFGTLPLGMNKIVLFSFGMSVPNPWGSLPRLLANAFIHTSDSETCGNFLYSCDILVMGVMTVLASNFLHAVFSVRICVARAYLGELWIHRDFRGAAGSMLGTLQDSSVVGIFDGSTLRDGAVVEIGGGPTLRDGVGDLVGINVTSIYCRVFIAYICSYPTANRDDGAELLSASARSYTNQCAASVDKCFGTGQLCGENSTVLTILSVRVAGT